MNESENDTNSNQLQRCDEDSDNKITIKTAVCSCWPEEKVTNVIRLIKDGYIEVLDVNKTVQQQLCPISTLLETMGANETTTIPSVSNPQIVQTFKWKIIRQHGKRMIRPNDYLRRRFSNEDRNSANGIRINNNKSGTASFNSDECYYYVVRQVPFYPIVIAMYKPCGYVVTRRQCQKNTDSISTTTATTAATTGNFSTRIRMEQQKSNNTNEDDMYDDNEDNDDDENSSFDDKNDTIHSNDGHHYDDVSRNSNVSLSVYDLLLQSTIYDSKLSNFSIVPWKEQLRAVGRLDKNTEGLLLFTNHGRWNIALTTPFYNSHSNNNRISHDNNRKNQNHASYTMDSNNDSNSFYNNKTTIIWKRYRCYLQNPATESDLQFWVQGNIPFRHMKSKNRIAYSKPALSATFVTTTAIGDTIVNNIDNNDNNYKTIVDVVIGEGKYRQIRRCWESLNNNKVVYLQRLSFGPIELFDTSSNTTTETSTRQKHDRDRITLQQQPGHCRLLSNDELQQLQRYVQNWYRHHPNYSNQQ